MAGIEKICEYSGEYPGWPMYGYKHNLIQVMPKYRELFKGQPSILFIKKEPHLVNYGCPGRIFLSLWYWKWKWVSIPRFWTRYYWIWRDVGEPLFDEPKRVWDYMLYSPLLPGNVEGKYYNYTLEPMKMIHKIRRLVGKKNLMIIPVYDLKGEVEYHKKKFLEDLREDGYNV